MKKDTFITGLFSGILLSAVLGVGIAYTAPDAMPPLNELPQLLNILMGDMSIIGPRPQTRRCFDAFPTSSQAEIVKVRPGLSGIGSIVFRDEEGLMHASEAPERFYDEVIMPYKGALEEWYVAHQGLGTYVLAIFVTAWVVLFPASRLAWRVFPGLPSAPPALAGSV